MPLIQDTSDLKILVSGFCHYRHVLILFCALNWNFPFHQYRARLTSFQPLKLKLNFSRKKKKIEKFLKHHHHYLRAEMDILKATRINKISNNVMCVSSDILGLISTKCIFICWPITISYNILFDINIHSWIRWTCENKTKDATAAMKCLFEPSSDHNMRTWMTKW